MVPYFMDNVNSPVREAGPRLAFGEDRRILAEEQRVGRARARRFSLENNRRRKALEERKKVEEVREQRLQEDILQQRRRKLQEATEQHQRAHLPPSQRRRPAGGRPAHFLDNAIRRIEGTFSLSELQSTFYTGSPSAYRRCGSSSSSPVASARLHQQRQLSAAVAYVKLLQEKGDDDRQGREPLFRSKLWEKQHPLVERWANSKQESPQDVSQPDQTENLSSLEMENSLHSPSHTAGPSHFTGYSLASFPSHTFGISLNPDHTQTSGRSPSVSPSHTPDHTQTSGRSPSVSPSHSPVPSQTPAVGSAASPWLCGSQLLRIFQSPGLLELSNGPRCASATSTESVGPDRWMDASLSSLLSDSLSTDEPGGPGEPGCECPPARGGHGGEEPQSPPETEPTPASAAPPVPSDPNSPTPAAVSDPPDPPSGSSDAAPLAAPRGAWVGPDAPPPESSGATSGGKAAESVRQVGNRTNRQPPRLSLTYLSLPLGETSRGQGSGVPFRAPTASLSTVNHNVSAPGPTSTVNAEPRQPNQTSTPHSNTTVNEDKERDRPENSDPSNQMKKSEHTEQGISNGSRSPDRETRGRPSADSASDPASSADVKLIKGILKKQSKYAPGLPKPSQMSASFNFPKQSAPPARDGVEPAKQDRKEPESGKKRLRWFDEERLKAAEEGWRSVSSHMGGKDTPPLLQRRAAQLQKHPLSPGRPTALQVATSVTSSGYHFAKRAWPDSGGREGPLLERRPGRSSPHRVGPPTPRAPRRAGSAPASPRLLSSQGRRGVGVRPQSATGDSWAEPRGAMTQGRTILPRPPPRAGVSVGEAAGSLPGNEAADSCAARERLTAMTVSGLTFTPFPPACTPPSSAPKNTSRDICISTQRDPPGSTTGESRQSPHSASTGQEVYQLWNGVRCTLAPKGSNSNPRSWLST